VAKLGFFLLVGRIAQKCENPCIATY